MSRFLGITRERVFSPGRVDDDRAVLDLTADALRTAGQAVTVCGGDDEAWPHVDGDTVVFAMCQGERALSRLQAWAARGVRIVNHPEGILNCQRHRTVPALMQAGVAFPESVLLATAAGVVVPPWVADAGAWIKRGDVHATDADDVIFVESAAAAARAIERFRRRGIARAVVQRHVPGIVLKFYGVRGGFFHCVPPRDGTTIATGVVHRLAGLAQQAARALNVDVYGGDCVCDVNGRLTIIDLNDWPSYAPCRAAGARAIAAYLLAPTATTET